MLTFVKNKPLHSPTTPRGRGSEPKVITATGTRTERPKTATGVGTSRGSGSKESPNKDGDEREWREERPRKGPPDDDIYEDKDEEQDKENGDKERKNKKDKEKKPKRDPPEGDDDDDDENDPFDSDDSDKVVASEAEKKAMKLLIKSIKSTKEKFGKEADSLTVPNIGSAASHRAWRITARAKVVSASGKGIVAFRWFNEIAKATSFEEMSIEKCPRNMQRLDTKLHAAIAEKCHGTLGRLITQKVEDMEKVDQMMSGRQATYGLRIHEDQCQGGSAI